jgi:hypothetical protein
MTTYFGYLTAVWDIEDYFYLLAVLILFAMPIYEGVKRWIKKK